MVYYAGDLTISALKEKGRMVRKVGIISHNQNSSE